MEPEKKSSGAFVGLVIIIIILIIGGIYIWMTNKKALDNQAPTTGNETVTTQDSNDLNSLEADVNGANTSTEVDINTVN